MESGTCEGNYSNCGLKFSHRRATDPDTLEAYGRACRRTHAG